MMKNKLLMIFSAGFFFMLSCTSTPEGMRLTPEGKGPVVQFDLHAKPIPEIPLPNNIATRIDPSSPTGRRINMSLNADTIAEKKVRKKVNTLDGFGIFSPVIVSFDAPLDLKNIAERHAKNHWFTDDAVLLVNVDRNSAGFGEAVRLDAGQGNFPLGLEWPWQYWDYDEHADSLNLMFETHDEDKNHNGKLDPYEDMDFDGVLDKPNTWSGKEPPLMTKDNFSEYMGTSTRPVDDLITFYEKETNTLIMWPLVPLREKTTYAVVLTKYLIGENGEPVKSPFPYVNHAEQTEDLDPLAEILADSQFNMTQYDIAFAWTFTTQSVKQDFEAIRAGIYGHGQLKDLAQKYPPDMEPRIARDKDDQGVLPDRPFMLPGEMARSLISVAVPILGYPPEVGEALDKDSVYTDYWVLGSFTTPYFLVDRDGIATPQYPADDNESFEIDLNKGTAVTGGSTVTFMCSIPKATADHKPPFPVMIYGHGFSGATFEIFGFAGRMAQYGFALCGLDAVGHGLALPTDEAIPYHELIPLALKPLGLYSFYLSLKDGRIRDLDNDGVKSSFDNGGDFWSYDLFHMRDTVRQTVVDHMQFIRILRSLGEIPWKADTNSNGISDDLMGDWNGDGIIDIGSKGNKFYPVWGQSMGGIVSSVLGAVEAAVPAATPISGGGGLIHIGIRSTNPGLPEAVLMPFMGPFVVFNPLHDENDTVEIAQMINDQHREYKKNEPERCHYYRIANTVSLKPGDRVTVRNLTNQKEVKAFRHPDGRGFRVSLPADAVSAVEKRSLLGLKDGDTQPVPVSCAPGTWTVPLDQEGKSSGDALCENPDILRSLLFGDAFEIEIQEGWDGQVKEVIKTFRIPVKFQGAVFPEGAPLVFIGTGYGKPRNTPDFRKLISIASLVVEKGDPIAYAHLYKNRLDFSYDDIQIPQTNLIIYHTIGDPNTPIASSLSLARAAGILDYIPASDMKSKNDRLLETYVAEGVEGFWRFLSSKWTVADWKNLGKLLDLRWPDEFDSYLGLDPPPPLPVHADPDNFDAGMDEFGEPDLDPPVRATVETPNGFLALRLPYTFPLGAHGVSPSDPSRDFNINNFVENQIGIFMSSNGKILKDDPCLADSSCSYLPETIREKN